MPLFSRKKLPSNPPATKRLASQSTQQPRPVCRWSAYAPQCGSSPLPFPRSAHTLTATGTAAGEFFLFGGFIGNASDYRGRCASSDLYVLSTRDFSTTLLQTSGEVPTPRASHGAALIGTTTLLICGGKPDSTDQNVLNHDSLYLLDLVSREWSRVVVNGPGPGGRSNPSTTVVGSKLFVFGGWIDGKAIDDMWTLDLNCLKSQHVWELYEPTPGCEKPLPRARHVSVSTEDRIIIFGGHADHWQHCFNDTWSFEISTRKWTELQCTGSIPSPCVAHAAVLVNDVMYVFGGSTGKVYLDDLYALQLSTQRWFKFDNVGPSPHGRSGHTMSSDGTRIFVLGGYSEKDVRSDNISLIHVFDTKRIMYPDPEPNAVNPNEKTAQLAGKSSTGPPTPEQPQNPTSSSSETHRASQLQNAATVLSGRPASPQITHEQNSGPKFVAPHSSSGGEVTKLELERQLPLLLAAQTERDQRIARLTDELARLKDELALKSALLEQAETNAAEAAKRAELELREHADRLLTQTSLVKQRDAELLNMQARLDELLLSRDQQHGKELTNILEEKESELEAIRLRLTDAEKGWAKSKEEADTLRSQAAMGSVNRDEDQVTRRLMERVRAIEAEMVSKRWNEKRIEEMECSNED